VATVTPSTTQDLVPIADRIRFMQLFRIGATGAVLLAWLTLPEVEALDPVHLLIVTACYLGLSIGSEAVWRLARGRGRGVFTGMLIADSLYLGWLAHITTGTDAPLRYLILLHLVAVSLLASFRTGLKLALWHSMVLFLSYQITIGALDQLLGRTVPDTAVVRADDLRQLLWFVGLFWSVAILTAAFGAANERELRRRRYDLEALARLAATLERAEDPGEVAEALVASLHEELGIERALVLAAPGEDPPALLAFTGVRPAGIEAVEPGARSVFTRVTTGHRTLLVSRLDPGDDPWLAALLPDARNLVVVPMTVEGRTRGAVLVEHAMRAGSRIERRVVSMIESAASQSALALGGAWLLEQVRTMATMDGLTGVANRRSFDTALAKELARAERNSDQVSLVLCDIDHFKKLNDTLGHQAGDRVLVEVAGVLARHVRAADTVARYGGEEFAVILPQTTEEDAGVVAEKLRKAIEHLETLVAVTISLGVSTYPEAAPDGVGLIQAADKALYSSKRDGRNRYTLASAVAAEPEVEPAG
jgi:diguanylate cyclase (GGDEF)-like protein